MSRNDSKLKDPNRRWFDAAGEGENYERRLPDQLKGLDRLLFELVPGEEVLDLGCAEGLISLLCLAQGAKLVVGYDIVPERIKTANRLAADRGYSHNASFYCRDLELLEFGEERFDITLALAIVHKMRDPEGFLLRAAGVTRKYLILRLPGAGRNWICDPRSGNKKLDSRLTLNRFGFQQFETATGHEDEWVGYFRRGECSI